MVYLWCKEKFMTTKEKLVVKEVLWILSLIAFLVFCSFLVNHQTTDILYFFTIITYGFYYIFGRE